MLDTRYGIREAVIERTENGKPYLRDIPLFFSVSHTRSKLFIALSDANIGIDAEETMREVNYPLLLKKFPVEEGEEIGSAEDFLRHWTVKESAIKWLGGTLAHDLQKLSFVKDRLTYGGLDIPVYITTKRIDGHIVSLCSERECADVELISL